MNVLVLTVGTRGDVQPYVALGRGLKASGHEVSICTCESFRSFVEEHGLKYAYMNNDMVDFMNTDDGKTAMENSGNLLEMIRTAAKLLPKLGAVLRRQIKDTWESTQGSKPDLILFHPKAIGAADFAERLNVPSMLAFYLPMYVATGEFPAMGMPNLRLGPGYNRQTYRFLTKVTARATGKFVKEWRKANGVPARTADRYLQRTDGEPIPALHAYSELVIPQPKDWPESAIVTGYWFLDHRDDWSPDAELREFLSGGEPPVYFGFGSIFGRDPRRVTQIVLDAIKRTGVRAILARGWGGLDTSGFLLPDSVMAVDSVPHDWLFPQVAAVVHHGGCGTTAAGLRAGRPTIVCPFFGDQPFWGARIQALGVGPAPIPQKRLSVEGLSAAIIQVTTDATMRRKADLLGQRIRSEDGVARAVRFINEWTERLKHTGL